MVNLQKAFDDYVAWYSWAASAIADDAITSHTAATVALHALTAGAGRDGAATAAQTAARNETYLRQTSASYGPNHRYVEWFIWARSSLGLSVQRCHEIATAAVDAVTAAGGQRSAQEAAIRLLLPTSEQINFTPSAAPEPVRLGSETAEVTPTLSQDRPAIAALLTHGVSLRWEAMVIATLLDLAARDHLCLYAESVALLCRISSNAPTEPLAPFEQLLFKHVIGRLSGDRTPVQALLPDYQDEDGNHWFRSFDSAAMDEARRLGLISGRQRTVHWSLQPGLKINAPEVGQAAVKRWMAVHDALRTAPRPPQLPEPGESVDDPMLAWAVALDTGPDLLYALLPAAPWSAVGDRWHEVRMPRSSKSSAPWWSELRPRLAERRVFTGRVIRRWTRVESSADYIYSLYFLAVDDGVDDEALVWRVNAAQYKRCPHDTDVHITVDGKNRLVDVTEAP